MNILDILRKYSDEEHRLSQKDITEILKTEYDMTADRKAIRRNILNLMDCGYNIGRRPLCREQNVTATVLFSLVDTNTIFIIHHCLYGSLLRKF